MESSSREPGSTPPVARPTWWRVLNVPNVLTSARLLLAIVVFALIPWGHFGAALAVFVVAASTDWVDGYWARRFNQITQVGRIFDPLVDKIIVCGMFIFLAAEPGSGIVAWMAVLVVVRELLVTALRSFIEQRGGDFSAAFSGKVKMVLQCVAAGASLVALMYRPQPTPQWLAWTLPALVGLAVLSTVYSGVGYVSAAMTSVLAADE